jgi:hypothetical protein
MIGRVSPRGQRKLQVTVPQRAALRYLQSPGLKVRNDVFELDVSMTVEAAEEAPLLGPRREVYNDHAAIRL